MKREVRDTRVEGTSPIWAAAEESQVEQLVHKLMMVSPMMTHECWHRELVARESGL